MSNKTLQPISIITNGDMSAASLTSNVIPLQWEDNVGIQVDWTGSPVGVFAVQVSLNYAVNNAGQVTNAGTWTTIPTSAFNGTYPVPGTTTSPGYLDMALLSAAFMRLVYTKTSGTGTLNALMVAKGI